MTINGSILEQNISRRRQKCINISRKKLILYVYWPNLYQMHS